MSRFPIPSGFWINYLRERTLDEPAVVRSPFAVSLVTPGDIFDALVTAAESERAGLPRALRLYLGDRDQVRRQTIDGAGAAYWDTLPRRDDRSLAGYGARLQQRGHECFALLLNESQRVIPAIWFRVCDFLRELYEVAGFPAGGADANIFAGNYHRTPFGVHTDDRDVFTWIVEGRKQFLVWPRAALDGVMGPGGRDAHDYADLRASAITLAGDAGDLLYWPHPYWHVAESNRAASELVTTLSIGLDRTLPAATWMRDALFELVRAPVIEPLASSARVTFDLQQSSRAVRALPRPLARSLAAHRRVGQWGSRAR